MTTAKQKSQKPNAKQAINGRGLGNVKKPKAATVYPKSEALGPLDPGRLLTLGEAARRLAISPATLGRVIKAGRLPVIKVGARAIRIRPEDLTRYITVNVR